MSPIVDETKVGQSADAIFHIQPAIPGSARYSSVREIVFEPAALFSPGTNYQVSIDTNGLLGIPPGTDHYTFGFDIQQQAFEIELGELRTATSQSDATALDGAVTTADYEESGPIEKMLTATYLDSPVTIAWEHSPDGRHHRFFMEDLKRQDEAASLRLQWDGAAIGVASQGKREIAIPPLNKFDVTNIQVVQGPRNYILVTFTDPLDPAQNVDGLVYIRNVSASTSIEGNTVKLYPQQIPAGEVTVNVNQGIRNIRGKRLQQGQSRNITFDQPKPEVRFVGKGVILPDDAHLKVPFEAINVNSVQVTAFEIYPDNIGQFLQSNTLDGSESLGMVGRFLWKKRISLGDVQPNQWQRFAIDTDEFMRSHTGGIIRLTLSINLGNSIYACTAKDTPPAADMQPKSMDSNEQTQSSGWDFAENYNENYYQGWLQRNDPCRNGYYIHSDATHVSRNFLVSNIGLLAKRDQHQNLNIVATDLRSATPLVGAELEVRNFQNQTLARATTDKDGFATVALGAVPFYLVAKKDGQAGYLKLNDATALPTSHFDVGGEKVTGGIKGAVYGERGVWRPGDDIHLTFVLRDPDNAIPANHPVSMELYNPKGQLVQTLTNTQPVGDFYTFTLKTPEDAPTGNWTAKAILGGTTFTKTLKIETVMPNRLKVELDLGDKPLKAKSEFEARLFGQWLHGAKASGLKADVKAELRSVPAHFTRYSDFTFDDPAREFSGSPQTLFEGKLDADGYAKFTSELIPGSAPPGELQADFTMRVFEGSGAFSISQISAPVHAYDRYIGIKLPKGDAARNMLLTDTKHTVQIAAVDADGNPVSAKRVQVTLYKIDWKWWWDKSGESLAKYESSSLTTALAHSVVEAKDGHGSWDFEIKYPDWGRYLIRACDQDSGHCTGKTLYVDWPGWAGRAQEGSGVSAAMLSLVSDKSDYEVGDTAVIQLPETSQGRALLTVESGSRIIQQRWLEVGQGRSKFELPVTAAMSPNVYVSVALLQPHQDKKNDRPTRLWGVIPIKVHDAKTVLEPVIAAADEWKPRQKVSF
ncbi:MAG TPA: MG2 domain-containing protein, partial [Mariprofundaceae bacterium]|nr:MG2 domain-containing protein [Mariprofundaceae bacterium]